MNILNRVVAAVETLKKNDHIEVNAIDYGGRTPIHLMLLEANNPLVGIRGNRSRYRLTQDRMKCAKLLLQTKAGTFYSKHEFCTLSY